MVTSLEIQVRMDFSVVELMCEEHGVEFKEWLLNHIEDDGVYEYFIKRLNSYSDEALKTLVDDFDFELDIDRIMNQEAEDY